MSRTCMSALSVCALIARNTNALALLRLISLLNRCLSIHNRLFFLHDHGLWRNHLHRLLKAIVLGHATHLFDALVKVRVR